MPSMEVGEQMGESSTWIDVGLGWHKGLGVWFQRAFLIPVGGFFFFSFFHFHSRPRASIWHFWEEETEEREKARERDGYTAFRFYISASCLVPGRFA